ncbi:hypothetical protein EI94DRAFT_1910877 [Lactarius quietus]|nr:hypothetical protein EI94DRAFT_1910877 [Lactarius quietus]
MLSPSATETIGPSVGPTTDEYTTEYHPHSMRAPEMQTLKEYISHKDHFSRDPPTAEPWRPFFNTCKDFEFAKILLEARVNRAHSEHLLKLFKKCLSSNSTLTHTSYSDIQTSWDPQTFPVLVRPLWDWAAELILNLQLTPYFQWDAWRIFRRNGETTTRMYHEPWTGDAFWNLQSRIPARTRPLSFILYADKTNLSSFGMAKGYPVVARCANLPVAIQNGNGIGGRRVVGWLPIVPETPENSHKPAFILFKHKVWHSAFRAVIASIIEKSEGGCWLQSGDGTQHLYFPAITMLSADYKEQCTMALIRGAGGKLPCPICLVPSDQLSNISRTWPLRDAEQTQGLLKSVRALDKARCETLLSQYGLHDVDNVFWLVANSDPHHALSFDRLHSNNSGLFGYHLWTKFKALITQIGCDSAAWLDQHFGLMPRWRGLNRFPKVMKVAFTDGAKYEDISKILVFAAHNIIKQNDSEGWQLMRCLRSFSILDLLLSFEVHTNESISAGEEEISRFGDLMKDKNWNFPKMHALVHSFDDIRAKGASWNYNTKPNEKLHGPLKKAYMQTNFEDVAPQILKIDHLLFVGLLIQSQIDEVDTARRMTDTDDLEIETLEAGAVTLGSQQPPLTLSYLESLTGQESHFINFRHRLSKWLTDMFNAYKYPFPPGCTCVTEYQSMKVCYESMVDSQQYLDYLHCSPKFHHVEQRDFVVVKTTSSFIFAKLLFIFTCSFAGNCFPICLAQPLDKPIGTPQLKDQDLRLHHVRARSSTSFFFTRSIVHGAPLVQDFDRVGDYFVMDVADHSGDLFLRCKEIFAR